MDVSLTGMISEGGPFLHALDGLEDWRTPVLTCGRGKCALIGFLEQLVVGPRPQFLQNVLGALSFPQK